MYKSVAKIRKIMRILIGFSPRLDKIDNKFKFMHKKLPNYA